MRKIFSGKKKWEKIIKSFMSQAQTLKNRVLEFQLRIEALFSEDIRNFKELKKKHIKDYE